MTGTGDLRSAETSRSLASLLGLGAGALVLVVVLLGLGTWQVYRRAWKLDLIARVNARVHAPPVAVPGREAWPRITAGSDEYRHVTVAGTFPAGDDTLVQAVTAYGPGFWVLTPLKSLEGPTILINRGFVPSDLARTAPGRARGTADPTTVTGLLRLTEPGGAFLRHNDPERDRWYSRDVAAIAARRGLGDVAPFFIDADGPPVPGRYPLGGLTVVRFPNNHLVYAVTWYALALMLAGAAFRIGRGEWRRRGGAPQP